jgi:phosphonate transport system ATP-binding protein
VLAYENVRHAYGERVVLDGASFAVARGECVALLGRSGAGKTTLFRLAFGAFDPDAGRVSVGGVDLRGLRGAALRRVRARIAVVFQAHELIDELSVAANVIAGTFGRRTTFDALRAVLRPNELERRAVHDALARVGLADRANDRAYALSGGQRQRVAVARAIAQRAELVLADEPAASLDPSLAREIVDLLLADARERGASLVCTLHQPELTRDFDRVVTVDAGRVVRDTARPETGVLDVPNAPAIATTA